MSKIKFGNFITYKGKNLATPKGKAVQGNLVFAEITEGADKGYYIFGGVAEGHLVTMDVFNALKKETKELIGADELEMPKHADGSYYSIVEYVNERLEAYKVKDVVIGATSIAVDGVVTLGDAAQRNVATEIAEGATGLATAGQVYDKVKAVQDAIDALPTYGVSGSTNISVTSEVSNGKHNFTVDITDKVATKAYVDSQVSKIDGVMEFKGLYEGEQLPTVTAESTDYNPGDVIVWKNKEYVLDKSYTWVEIGQVRTDEAVTSLGGVKGDITLGTGLSMEGQQLTVTFPDELTTSVKGKAAIGVTGVVTGNNTEYEVSLKLGSSGNVSLYQDANGLTAHIDAEDLEYTNAKAGATVADVKGALDELYDDKEVVAQALVDLKSGISGLDTRLDTIEADYVKSVSLDKPTEDSPYISITPTKGDVKIDLSVATTANAILNIDQADDALVSAKALREYSIAENITVTGITGQTNVQDTLENLYEQVAALNSDVKDASEITYTAGTGVTTSADNVSEALDDLYTQLATLDGAVVMGVTGDTASYSEVVSSEDDEQVKIVKNVLADNVVGEDGNTTRVHGLVTDEYLDEALAWDDISD